MRQSFFDKNSRHVTCLSPYRLDILLDVLLFLLILSSYHAVHAGQGGAVGSECSPMRIFLLMGESNMAFLKRFAFARFQPLYEKGQASEEHLQDLSVNSRRKIDFEHLWNDDTNSYATRDDVYVHFYNHQGPLTFGFGDPENGGNHFGPELEFGWVVGDALSSSGDACAKPIVLLKIADNDLDLAIDFRPPTATAHSIPGRSFYSQKDLDERHAGWFYKESLTAIQSALTDESLSNLVPNYNVSEGYELSGMVWFQGWSDVLDRKKCNEYQYNLIQLIRDLRRDLKTFHMPIVIGETGQFGFKVPTDLKACMNTVRAAQFSITMMSEFSNSTKFVATAHHPFSSNSMGVQYSTPEKYYGRADTILSIGRSMGFAMLEFLEGTETS